MPEPAKGEVLIRVAAAGINRPDIVQRQGHYPPPPGASDLPGMEVAGVIAAIGPEVTGFSPGDEVTALLSGGGYAEYAIAAAPLCLPIPSGLSMVEAAALPETFFTVWTNLFERGGCKAGDTVLIHGGNERHSEQLRSNLPRSGARACSRRPAHTLRLAHARSSAPSAASTTVPKTSCRLLNSRRMDGARMSSSISSPAPTCNGTSMPLRSMAALSSFRCKVARAPKSKRTYSRSSA